MQKIIVAAKSDNLVIGKENELIWHLPADLRFFLSIIEGAYLLTGRKSYESAQGEAVFSPNRKFVIVTRNKNYQSKYGKVAHSLYDAIEIAKKDKAKRLCILGGAKIYQQAMVIADKIVLTEVHEQFEGDTFFPKIDLTQWKEISRTRFSKDQDNPFDYSFVEYERY